MEITKYQKAKEGMALIAFISIAYDNEVHLPGGRSIRKPRYINNIKVFQKNGRRWIAEPDQKYEKDGETKYAPYCGFTERCDDFSDEVVKALDVYCTKNSQQECPF